MLEEEVGVGGESKRCWRREYEVLEEESRTENENKRCWRKEEGGACEGNGRRKAKEKRRGKEEQRQQGKP